MEHLSSAVTVRIRSSDVNNREAFTTAKPVSGSFSHRQVKEAQVHTHVSTADSFIRIPIMTNVSREQ